MARKKQTQREQGRCRRPAVINQLLADVQYLEHRANLDIPGVDSCLDLMIEDIEKLRSADAGGYTCEVCPYQSECPAERIAACLHKQCQRLQNL